jgi:hypothetical protein
MRRATVRKKFPFYTMLLEAMRRDLKRLGNATHEQARELRDRLIKECGWKGRLAATFGGPYVAHRLKAEQLRHERSVEMRQAPEPQCLVTHYGTFELRTSPDLPAPGPTPPSVAIARPRTGVGEDRIASLPDVVRARPAPVLQPQCCESEL